VSIEVREGDPVAAGQKLVILESMKMEHVITSDRGGYVRGISVSLGDVVVPGDPLVFLEEADISIAAGAVDEQIDLAGIRPDLEDVIKRYPLTRTDPRQWSAGARRTSARRARI
jgi:pyruvate/2-oxoglutarate dehydrogenase complex dihydrolipoamide acyltransferase (E2) component